MMMRSSPACGTPDTVLSVFQLAGLLKLPGPVKVRVAALADCHPELRRNATTKQRKAVFGIDNLSVHSPRTSCRRVRCFLLVTLGPVELHVHPARAYGNFVVTEAGNCNAY